MTAKTPAALLSWLDISGIDAHGQDGTVRMRTGSEIPKKNSSRKLYLIHRRDAFRADSVHQDKIARRSDTSSDKKRRFRYITA